VHGNKKRGTDPGTLSPATFVVFLQNHDQIGNRALGERLHYYVDLSAYRAATALLLGSPLTPLLYMGQEWAASTPFLFFTDHNPKLGKLVTEGRRREFKQFSAFTDPQARERIPDPQALSTFQASRLDWAERDQEPHASTLRLYRALLQLRRTEAALRYQERNGFDATALGDATLLIQRWAPNEPMLLVLVHLRGAGRVDLGHASLARAVDGRRWEVVLTTEDAPLAPDARPPRIDLDGRAPVVQFARPAAVILREIGSAA
jgi:maltooligosyltrehalose trehalohydrolase